MADIYSMIEPRATIIKFTPGDSAKDEPTVRLLDLIEAMIANLAEYGLVVEHTVEVDQPLIASIVYRLYFHGRELGNIFPGIRLVAKFTPRRNDLASLRLLADFFVHRIERVTIDYFDGTGEWELEAFDRIAESTEFGDIRVLGVLILAIMWSGDEQQQVS